MNERPGSSRYRVVRTIKRGPSSEVLEGFVQSEGAIERRVAIKRLLSANGELPISAEQFVDEARIVSQLHHANIVNLYDFGVEDGQPFLVLEYVDGLDLLALAELAERHRKKVPLELALHIVAEVAQALAHAHEARGRDGALLGIIHRDVTPNNILISWAGDVRLTDFGIARSALRATRTAVGLTKGTLLYMAPEQLSGGPLDARADIFGLGCVLHRLVAGHSPLERAESVAEWDGSLDPGLLPAVAQIIQRATHRSVRERYRDARAMATDCWRASTKRLDRDARGALFDWLRSLRELSAAPVSSVPAAGAGRKIREMFDPLALKNLADGAPAPLGRAKTVRPLAGDDVAGSEDQTKFERPELVEEATTLVALPEADKVITDGYGVAEPTPQTPQTPPSPTALSPAMELGGSGAGDPYLGKILHGYRLTALLGVGSWTRVYRAEHQFLHYECAIKVAATTSKNIAARILREAQALAKIAHPNLVTVLDCGITESGAPFFTMELISGRTLHQALTDEGPFSPQRARRLTRQIALGLVEAHRHGLVHRDLKPANLMLIGSGTEEQIKILDFGLVRLLAPQSGEPLTAQNQIVGTPAYMSPEQIQGETTVGPQSDLYSLGVILFEMLTGAPPFRGLNVIDTMHQHVSSPPPPLAPAGGLEELALALLAKSTGSRIKSAEELIRRLDGLPAGIEISSPTPIDLEQDTVKPEPVGAPSSQDLSRGPEEPRLREPERGSSDAGPTLPPARPMVSLQRGMTAPAVESRVESEPMVRAVASSLPPIPAGSRKRSPVMMIGLVLLVIAAIGWAILFALR